MRNYSAAILTAILVSTSLLACSSSKPSAEAADTGAVARTVIAPSGSYTEPPTLPVTLVQGMLTPSEQATPTYMPVPAVAVEGRAVMISGVMRTPTPCYGLRPYRADLPRAQVAAQSGAPEVVSILVSVVVTPPASGVACAEQVTERTYQLKLPDLPPGSYSIQVSHRFDGVPASLQKAGWDNFTYSTPIVKIP